MKEPTPPLLSFYVMVSHKKDAVSTLSQVITKSIMKQNEFYVYDIIYIKKSLTFMPDLTLL